MAFSAFSGLPNGKQYLQRNQQNKPSDDRRGLWSFGIDVEIFGPWLCDVIALSSEQSRRTKKAYAHTMRAIV